MTFRWTNVFAKLGKKLDDWLVDGWKSCLKWYSTYGLAVLAAAPIIRENFELVRDVLPSTWWHYGMTTLAVLTFIARVKRQGEREHADKD